MSSWKYPGAMPLSDELGPSRRKRSRASSSEEEVRAEIDDRARFRVGHPQWLPVLPVAQEILTPEQAREWGDLDVGKLVDILMEYDVDPGPISLVHRFTIGTKPNSDSITVFIIAKRPQGGYHKALVAVKLYLLDQGMRLRVEMMDPFGFTMYKQPMIHTELVRTWNMFSSGVVSVLRESRSNWLSVNVWMRKELEHEEPVPTVIVVASDVNDNTLWRTIKRNLERACSSPERGEFAVELRHSPGLTGFKDSDVGANMPKDAWKNDLYTGSSFGETSRDNTGTAGGKVVLLRRANGEEKRITTVLSNYNVVRSTDMAASHDSRQPIRPTHAKVVSKQWKVASPSQEDHDHRMTSLQVLRTQTQNQIQKFQSKTHTSSPSSGDTPNLQKAKRELERINEEGRELSTANRDVGHVFAASGFRTYIRQNSEDGKDHHFALDWSLSEIDNTDKIFHNISPDPPFRGPPKYILYPGDFNKWTRNWNGQNVAKKGRTTGWTYGVVTSPVSILAKKLYEPYAMDKGEMMARCCSGLGQDSRFADAGDLGSIIFEAEENELDAPKHGCWVGLLHGNDKFNDFTYFIPMEMLIEDIQLVTGCEVIEPVRF